MHFTVVALALAFVSPALATIIHRQATPTSRKNHVAAREITDITWEGERCTQSNSIYNLEPYGDTQISMSFNNFIVSISNEPGPYKTSTNCSLSFPIPMGYDITTLETRLYFPSRMFSNTTSGTRTFTTYLDGVLKGTHISKHSFDNNPTGYLNEDVYVDASESEGAIYKLQMDLEMEGEDATSQGYMAVSDLEIQVW